MRRLPISVWLATYMGLGFFPIAPGTLGTLMTVPIVWGMQFVSWQWQLYIVLMFVPLAIAICHMAARNMGKSDPGAIVLDEVIGFMLACIALPPGLVWLVAAFVAFRLLDIFKPWPIDVVERKFSGGIGIVLDDLMAGGICWLLIQGSALFWGTFGADIMHWLSM